jgi:cytochrome c oxidase subunit 2
MPFQLRPRWPGTRGAGAAALTVALLALSACSRTFPNSVFHNRTDFNRDAVGYLFNLIIWLGVIVFVLVEGLLVWTMIKYRSRPGRGEPEHVHGNTTLEIAWTIIPALVLLWIAIPTVRTIFRTEAPAPANALQVQVIGHQWWWEFRYPQYKVVTANELYLPLGRTVNFRLTTADVIHSFWIPALAGKRDVVHQDLPQDSSHANYIWFTPDSTTEKAFNGVCAEYCGTSHANMRFRAFVVSPAEFESWAQYQATPAAVTLAKPPAPPAPTPAPTGAKGAVAKAPAAAAPAVPSGPVMTQSVVQAGYFYPADQMPLHILPTTPLPDGLTFDDNILAQGDAARGADLIGPHMGGGCIGCHTIFGTIMTGGLTGPNLTHVGSRNTIAAGLYPNDAKHLALWIKNARMMKPGIIMPTLGKGQIDPTTKTVPMTAVLTDQQIADIVAYLRALK